MFKLVCCRRLLITSGIRRPVLADLLVCVVINLNIRGYKIISGMQKATSQKRNLVNLHRERNENLNILSYLLMFDSMAQM